MKILEKELDFTPKTFKQIKEYDTYIIEENLIDGIDVPSDYKIKPVFTEGVIKLTNIGGELNNNRLVYYFYINSNEDRIECYSYDREVYRFEFIYVSDFFYEKGEHTMNFSFSNYTEKMTEKEKKEGLATAMSTLIFSAMTYISYKLETVNVTVKQLSTPRAKRSTSSATPKAPQKRTLQVLNKDKVLYKVETYNKGLANAIRTYTRRVSSWNVLGHYRHYKSGKKVWVNPYQKGEGRKEAKRYIIK